MQKLTLLFAILTLSTALLAEAKTVDYVYPVYNDGEAIKGIQKWENDQTGATIITSTDEIVTLGSAGAKTWYAVTGTDITIAGIVCIGNVNLILADGAKLSAISTADLVPGIQVTGTGNSLTIYGQTAQSGELYVKGGRKAAGIGGGQDQDGSNITINGGEVSVWGGYGAAGIGGGYNGSGYNITINGGKVGASSEGDDTGLSGAGIGGGGKGEARLDSEITTDGHDIIINGGEVEANGFAAGIGGGYQSYGYNITINGGKVSATGMSSAAGIGGGNFGIGHHIAIHGGMVTAIGGYNGGAGIGGGQGAISRYITITDGVVIAYGGSEGGDGIGNGANASGSQDIIVATRCIVRVGNSENSTNVIENDGTDLASKLRGQRYVTTIDELTDAYNNGYAAGKAAGRAELQAELPTDAADAAGHTVTITKGKKSLKLVNPDKVEFGRSVSADN